MSKDYWLLWLNEHMYWNIPLLVVVVCIVVLYVVIGEFSEGVVFSRRRRILFFIGLGLLFLILGSPLEAFSHLSFSLHMIQMSVLLFFVPPILLLGIPTQVMKQVQEISIFKRVPFLFSPMVALITFAVLFLLYHMPIVLSVFTRYPVFHNGYTALLLVLSFIMWWPITRKNSKGVKYKDKKYLLLSGLFIMPACFFFILNCLFGEMSNSLLGEVSSNLCVPVVFISYTPINARIDQLSAGFLMLGMHKTGILVTTRVRNKIRDE